MISVTNTEAVNSKPGEAGSNIQNCCFNVILTLISIGARSAVDLGIVLTISDEYNNLQGSRSAISKVIGSAAKSLRGRSTSGATINVVFLGRRNLVKLTPSS